MFCTKCGNNIPENMKFCPRCGEKTEEATVQINRNYNSYNMDIKFNHSIGKIAGGVFLCLLCVAIVIVLSILLFNIDVWKESERLSKKESLNNLKTWIIILIVHFFVLYILNCIKLRAVSNTELFLSKEGVFGTGGTPNYFGNISFCCKYQDIMSVRMKGSVVCVYTTTGCFKLWVDDSNMLLNELYRRINKEKIKKTS